MFFNYHTHTFRCKHATGSEREYIENAIKSGIKTLGFSDHIPVDFSNGFVSGCRMTFNEAAGYFDTVRKLAEEYKDKIKILCGFESEYSPSLHKEQMKKIEKYSPDYMILGQHYIGEEWEGRTSASQKTDEGLYEYVEQTLTAMNTGDFLYLAHPDIIGYRFSDIAIEKAYTRLCEGARDMNIPLEINFLGIRGGRHYPSIRFFEIAKKVGNKVIFGIDAHSPEDFLHQSAEKKAEEMVENIGLDLITEPIL